jgi:acylphosphatase
MERNRRRRPQLGKKFPSSRKQRCLRVNSDDLRFADDMLIYFSLGMKARAHIFVSGRVQGVFFRDHTQRWSSSLGLTGWVRNLMDGRVEVLAEGDKPQVENIIRKLKEGPPFSHVEKVEVSWEEYTGEFDDFHITWANY